jgi:hypothetical protein
MSARHLALPARKVLDALNNEFVTAAVVAMRAGLPTRERADMAARACEALERLGLVVRGGTPERPRWRRPSPERP